MALPDILYSQAQDFRQGIQTIVGSIILTGLCANSLYRVADSYNSDVSKIALWFGTGNHKTANKNLLMIWISVIHSACAVVGQQLFSVQSASYAFSAIMLYGLRIVRAIYDVNAMEKEHNRKPSARSNKKGIPFTLEDLAKGPKFEDAAHKNNYQVC